MLAGESIPIRLFLAGYDLTPTMRDVAKRFSVKYFLNLVLIDEEDRRYFKQQVLNMWIVIIEKPIVCRRSHSGDDLRSLWPADNRPSSISNKFSNPRAQTQHLFLAAQTTHWQQHRSNSQLPWSATLGMRLRMVMSRRKGDRRRKKHADYQIS